MVTGEEREREREREKWLMRLIDKYSEKLLNVGCYHKTRTITRCTFGIKKPTLNDSDTLTIFAYCNGFCYLTNKKNYSSANCFRFM